MQGGEPKPSITLWSKYRVLKRSLILAVAVVVAIGIFSLGVSVGNGSIAIGRQTTGLPANLNYSSVNQVYQALRDNYDGKLTETQVLNGIKHGLADSPGDPYTEYFTPAEAKAFNNQLNNTFSGIGAELGADSSGNLQIIAPVAGTPAASAGLQPGDYIVTINGTSTSGLSVDDAVNLIRGKAGTKVTLGIVRGNQQLSIAITRQNITVPSVNYKILSGNIGYLQITTFADDTANLVQKAAEQFSSDHVNGIVLDLRNDPGGLLSAAVSTSSLWLTNGQTILTERQGTTVIQSYQATGTDLLNGIPTVVLINAGSASASEITTGALHDNHDAYVIGQKSYGKGVVQQLINFGDGSQLKVTVASWYRPDGKNINKLGITPDMTVNMNSQQINTSSDTQLSAALSYLSQHQ